MDARKKARAAGWLLERLATAHRAVDDSPSAEDDVVGHVSERYGAAVFVSVLQMRSDELRTYHELRVPQAAVKAVEGEGLGAYW